MHTVIYLVRDFLLCFSGRSGKRQGGEAGRNTRHGVAEPDAGREITPFSIEYDPIGL